MSRKSKRTFYPSYQLRRRPDELGLWPRFGTLLFEDLDGNPFSTKASVRGMTETHKHVLRFLSKKSTPPVVCIVHGPPKPSEWNGPAATDTSREAKLLQSDPDFHVHVSGEHEVSVIARFQDGDEVFLRVIYYKRRDFNTRTGKYSRFTKGVFIEW